MIPALQLPEFAQCGVCIPNFHATGRRDGEKCVIYFGRNAVSNEEKSNESQQSDNNNRKYGVGIIVTNDHPPVIKGIYIIDGRTMGSGAKTGAPANALSIFMPYPPSKWAKYRDYRELLASRRRLLYQCDGDVSTSGAQFITMR